MNNIGEQGFTLIEVMISLAIIAILAILAFPSYQQYIRKTHRAEMQAELIQIASQLQRYHLLHQTYLNTKGEPIGLSEIGYPSSQQGFYTFPLKEQALYKISLENVSAHEWELVARPILGTKQQFDGVILLNHKQERCWKEVEQCQLSPVSNWNLK